MRSAGLLFLAAMFLPGCQSLTNPSFDVSMAAAKEDLQRMQREPRPLQRPLIILGGFVDVLGIHRRLEHAFHDRLTGGPIIAVGFIDCDDFEACRQKLLAEIARLPPGASAAQTIEVDVLGYSMGGLVARYAAAPPADLPGPRLKIRRLFTIASPHRGADIAGTLAPGELAQAMRPDSLFMRGLQQREAAAGPVRFELLPYVILGDGIVGQERAAPEGDVAWWIDDGPNAHLSAVFDPRIRADILRRLRGETPYTTLPRAPLPAK